MCLTTSRVVCAPFIHALSLRLRLLTMPSSCAIFLFLCLSGTPTSSIGRVMICFTWWARSPGLRRRLLQLLLLLRQVVPPHGVSLHRIPLGFLTLLLPLLRSVRRERTCLFVDSTTCSRCASLSSGVASRFRALEEPFVEKSRVARDSGDQGISSNFDLVPTAST